jgi:hypothetical protein
MKLKLKPKVPPALPAKVSKKPTEAPPVPTKKKAKAAAEEPAPSSEPRGARVGVAERRPDSPDATGIRTMKPLTGRLSLERQCARLGLFWAEHSCDTRSPRRITLLIGKLYEASDDESVDGAYGRIAEELSRLGT